MMPSLFHLHRWMVLGLGMPSLLAAETRLDFNRDIRPILSDNCFACHGFDAKKRKAGLRLDVAEGAYQVVDGVQAVKPGDPDASSIVQRILSQDEDEVIAYCQTTEIDRLMQMVWGNLGLNLSSTKPHGPKGCESQ